MSDDPDLQRMTWRMRQLRRAVESMGESVRLATDALIRADRREWEFPEAILGDEERDAFAARQLGRTLAEIDDLPEYRGSA